MAIIQETFATFIQGFDEFKDYQPIICGLNWPLSFNRDDNKLNKTQ